MTTAIREKNASRTELRLSASDKELFEYAKEISGFTTLAEFMRTSIREKAEAIVNAHERILNTERDKEIFFDALMSPPPPNEALKNAIALHQSIVAD